MAVEVSHYTEEGGIDAKELGFYPALLFMGLFSLGGWIAEQEAWLQRKSTLH